MELFLQNLHSALNKTALVGTLDVNGLITQTNEKFLDSIGCLESEIIGRSFVELISNDLPAVLRSEISSSISRGSPWKGQILYKTKSNRAVWIEASLQPSMDESEKTSGFIFIGFDTTEQKMIEEALNNNKVFVRKLMASAPVGFFLADGNGRCQMINTKWSEMSGLRLRQAAGDGWLNAVHIEDRKRVQEAWSELVANGADFQLEFRYCNDSKNEISVLASAAIFKDSVTHETQVLRVEQDLTEQKRNYEIINAQKAQMVATAKLTSLGEMSSSIAHEINNPLAAILGSAELLKTTLESQNPDPVRLNRMADTIMKTTVRIAKIIKSLRMISRDADRDAFELKEVATIFQDTSEMCTATARTQQTHLQFPTIPPELKIKCNSTQIAQTLLALVKNSLWAVKDLKEKWITIEVKDLGSQIQISVTDSGAGLSEDIRNKVFNPFFTTKPVGKGMGLGLSVAKGVIEKHQGELWLDTSCANTRFVITLPKEPAISNLRQTC